MRTYSLLLFLTALLCFQACKKFEKEAVKDKTEIPQTILDKIKAQGFSTRNVHQIRDGYIVEGDIFLSEKALNEITPSLDLRIGKTEQYRTLNVITGLPRVITIAIQNLPSGYTSALDVAIARYNALDLRLSFLRVSSGADITIDYENVADERVPHSAAPPTLSGNPGSLITLNPNEMPYYSEEAIATVIAHEIGHAIGFRHTDYFSRYSCIYSEVQYNEGQGAGGAIHIPGTPGTVDGSSWMKACFGGDIPFSANDIIALNYLYGTPTTIPIASGPGASYRKGTGILDVFARSSTNHLLHKMWTGQAGWSNWVDLGGDISSEPAAISRTSATIDVFAKGDSGNLVHRFFADTLGWSGWENLGGNITSAPAVASRTQNTMNVFAKSSTNTLLHLGYNKDAFGWESWEDLGGSIIDGPAAVSRQSISVNIFSRNSSNALVHISWSDGWGWSSWENLGGSITSAPAVISRVYTNMDIFAKGASNNLVHLGWNGSGSGWGSWQNLGGNITSAPTAATREAPSLNVFAKGTSSELVHIWWHEMVGWSSWESL